MFSFDIHDIEMARALMERVNLPAEFGCSGDDGEFYQMDDMESEFEDAAKAIGIDAYDVSLNCGASKLVVNIRNFPFVIKIPFGGFWYDEYDEDADDYGDSYFEPFRGYSCGNKGMYCADEMDATAAMKQHGFGVLVPDMMYLGTYCGKEIFIQEKVVAFDYREMERAASQNSMTIVKNSKKLSHEQFNPTWMAYCIDLYGLKFLEDFVDWANEEYPSILSDMHTGNYGTNKEGKPVIFDLSGFFE